MAEVTRLEVKYVDKAKLESLLQRLFHQNKLSAIYADFSQPLNLFGCPLIFLVLQNPHISVRSGLFTLVVGEFGARHRLDKTPVLANRAPLEPLVPETHSLQRDHEYPDGREEVALAAPDHLVMLAQLVMLGASRRMYRLRLCRS